jgi:hypothetical protein
MDRIRLHLLVGWNPPQLNLPDRVKYISYPMTIDASRANERTFQGR